MIERDTAVAFDALAAIPNTFFRPSPGRPMPNFLAAAFASAAAALASRLAFRSARNLSAASSASLGVSLGVAADFLAIVSSEVKIFTNPVAFKTVHRASRVGQLLEREFTRKQANRDVVGEPGPERSAGFRVIRAQGFDRLSMPTPNVVRATTL